MTTRRRPKGKLLLAAAVSATLSGESNASPAPAAEPFGFTVVVSLSPTAAARLARLREGVVVSASYYGDPKPAFAARADQVGQIDLGAERVVLGPAAGAARLSGRAVRDDRLAWLVGGAAEVNVNVFSARLSGPDNILDCAFFQDAVAVARRAPVRLACKLIGKGHGG